MTDNTNPKADRYRGKRYICLARQSNDRDGTTSTEAQIALMRSVGEDRGMIKVDQVVLIGVTGSLPGKRDDLKELFERKRTKDDFDVIMVQRVDRLTRGGADHGGWLHHEASMAGIEIMYIGDDLPEDGSYRSILSAMKFQGARDQARSIGQRSVQGWVHSYQRGNACVVSRTPFGCDRLYFDAAGEPAFVIRNLGDGRQLKLRPETGEVIDTLGRIGGGTEGHYRKQRHEGVELCPGDPHTVEIVRRILDLRYNVGMRGKRIADDLNRRGWRSPTGKAWSQRQVDSITENPVYCGVALGSRMSQGIYYRRGENGPEEVEIPEDVLATCRTVPRTMRPPDEWIWQEQPLMADFLPEPLRQKMLEEIQTLLLDRYKRSLNPQHKQRSKNKYKDSPYILTELLFAKQDGEGLSGVLRGRAGKKKRKYRHLKGQRDYVKGSVFNGEFDAVALETAVLNLVAELLADVPDLRQHVADGLRTIKPQAGSEDQLQKLVERRDEVAKKTQRVFMLAAENEDAKADVQEILDGLQSQRQDLDQQIAEMRKQIGLAEVDPETIVDAVVKRYESLDLADMTSLSVPAQREIVRAFVERVEADMETKDVTVHLKMPPWALSEGVSGVGVVNSSRSPTVDETLTVHLAWADCEYVNVVGSNRPVTYRCRRRAAA